MNLMENQDGLQATSLARSLRGVPKRPPKQHAVIAVTLGSRQLNWLADVRRRLAHHRVSRSEIVRAAIDGLADRFADRTADELARYIADCARDDRIVITSLPSTESAE